jgi:hypothetical protein
MTYQESDENANYMNAEGCSSIVSLDNKATGINDQPCEREPGRSRRPQGA